MIYPFQTRLEETIKFSRKSQEDYILVASRILSFGSKIRFYSMALTNEQTIQKLLSNNCIYHSTVMINKVLLKSETYRSDFCMPKIMIYQEKDLLIRKNDYS